MRRSLRVLPAMYFGRSIRMPLPTADEFPLLGNLFDPKHLLPPPELAINFLLLRNSTKLKGEIMVA